MKPQMILVAGPYRSGTNDDPVLIAKNVEAMMDASLHLFRAGTCLSWANGMPCH